MKRSLSISDKLSKLSENFVVHHDEHVSKCLKMDHEHTSTKQNYTTVHTESEFETQSMEIIEHIPSSVQIPYHVPRHLSVEFYHCDVIGNIKLIEQINHTSLLWYESEYLIDHVTNYLAMCSLIELPDNNEKFNDKNIEYTDVFVYNNKTYSIQQYTKDEKIQIDENGIESISDLRRIKIIVPEYISKNVVQYYITNNFDNSKIKTEAFNIELLCLAHIMANKNMSDYTKFMQLDGTKIYLNNNINIHRYFFEDLKRLFQLLNMNTYIHCFDLWELYLSEQYLYTLLQTLKLNNVFKTNKSANEIFINIKKYLALLIWTQPLYSQVVFTQRYPELSETMFIPDIRQECIKTDKNILVNNKSKIHDIINFINKKPQESISNRAIQDMIQDITTLQNTGVPIYLYGYNLANILNNIKTNYLNIYIHETDLTKVKHYITILKTHIRFPSEMSFKICSGNIPIEEKIRQTKFPMFRLWLWKSQIYIRGDALQAMKSSSYNLNDVIFSQKTMYQIKKNLARGYIHIIDKIDIPLYDTFKDLTLLPGFRTLFGMPKQNSCNLIKDTPNIPECNLYSDKIIIESKLRILENEFSKYASWNIYCNRDFDSKRILFILNLFSDFKTSKKYPSTPETAQQWKSFFFGKTWWTPIVPRLMQLLERQIGQIQNVLTKKQEEIIFKMINK